MPFAGLDGAAAGRALLRRHGTPRKPANVAYPLAAIIRLDSGIAVACEGGDCRDGDAIAAHVGDDLIGTADLRPEGPAGRLTAVIPLTQVPPLAFPARIRLMNARSLEEIGAGLALDDADALRAAAGPPVVAAVFDGYGPEGPAFRVTPDRLSAYRRRYVLHLDGHEAATAESRPDEADGGSQTLSFRLGRMLPLGTRIDIIEAMFGVPVLTMTYDATHALTGALAQVARLEGEVAALRAALETRLAGAAFDLGRERLLLDRLDLFYLLLSERIGRVGRTEPAAAPPPSPPAVQRFGPADLDGIGIFDVETDGHQEWRWFGPDATIALRNIAGPVRRVVLYFHSFGDATEPPGARVSTGGAAERIPFRSLEGRYALDVPVRRADPSPDGMLIIHVSFDRHQSSLADPRLLSAVYSGAEVFSA